MDPAAHDALARKKNILEACIVGPGFFAGLFLLSSGMPLVWDFVLRRGRAWYRFRYVIAGYVFLASCSIWLGIPVAQVLIYYPIPRIFTFGFRIGGFAPASCAASMPVEGPNGTPCSLARFLDWLRHAYDAGFSGDWHMEEFEAQWSERLADYGFLVAVSLGFSAMFAFALFTFDEQEWCAISEKVVRGEEWSRQPETEHTAMPETGKGASWPDELPVRAKSAAARAFTPQK